MEHSTRTRWFTAISRLTLHRPGLVVAVSTVVVLGFGALIPGLEVTTSRYSLVSSENPYQARLFAFFERFGQLNVRSSEELDRLVADAQQIVEGVEPQSLRDQAALRQHVATEMSRVQSVLDGLLVDRPRRKILRRPR